MATEISFYHLSTTPVERALPALVEKAYESGMKVLVLADKDKIKLLDDMLWTANQQKFLPHGVDQPEIQPIFLSTDLNDKAVDGREVLTITNGEKYQGKDFKKVLDVFDGNIEADLASARARYKAYKDAGVELKYWFQDDKGKWVQK